jgi:hypothetical protein
MYECTYAITGFVSGGEMSKHEALCFVSSSLLADSFVFLNPPLRKSQNRWHRLLREKLKNNL